MPCSVNQTDQGAGRNSSMSMYSMFHAFSTFLMESVGRSLATKYQDGLDIELSLGSVAVGNDTSSESMDVNGLVTGSTPGCFADSKIVGSPILPDTAADGDTPIPGSALRYM